MACSADTMGREARRLCEGEAGAAGTAAGEAAPSAVPAGEFGSDGEGGEMGCLLAFSLSALLRLSSASFASLSLRLCCHTSTSSVARPSLVSCMTLRLLLLMSASQHSCFSIMSMRTPSSCDMRSMCVSW